MKWFYTLLLPLVGLTSATKIHAAELTLPQRKIVDTLVARRISAIREGIIKENNLEANVKQLSLRKKEWQAWNPAMRIGWSAKQCRDNRVPVPKIINEQVVDDIIWQYTNAYGIEPNDSKYHREECARALGFIGHLKAVPTILQSLEREGGHFSWQALEGITDERFISAIEKHLDFTNEQDASPAIRCLAKIGEAAIPTLQRFLAGKDLTLQRGAVNALIKIGTPTCIPILQEAQKTDVGRLVNIQAGILKIRCRTIDKVHTPLILPAQDDSRLWHLTSLALFDHLPPLPPDYNLTANNENIRSNAKDALVKIGPPAFGALREQLSSNAHYDDFTKGPDFYVSKRAADILKEIGQPAIPCLIDALCDRHSHTRSFAVQTLRQLTGQKFEPRYEVWSKWFLSQQQGKRD